MAHILLITTGLTGVLHAGFEVMSRLEIAGHRLTYACPRERRAEVEAQGFAYEQLSEVLAQPIDRTPDFPQRWRRILYRLIHIKQRRKDALTDLKIEEFTATLQRLQPRNGLRCGNPKAFLHFKVTSFPMKITALPFVNFGNKPAARDAR